MFLIRFWRNITIKDSVESAKYEIKKVFYLYLHTVHFFSWLRIFRIGSGFLANPDPEKNSIRIMKKKTGSETLFTTPNKIPHFKNCSLRQRELMVRFFLYNFYEFKL